jgi:hypothetical protein
MLHAHVDSLPFPRSLIFDDVEPDVLFAEQDAEAEPDAPAAWLSFMRRVMPQQVGA